MNEAGSPVDESEAGSAEAGVLSTGGPWREISLEAGVVLTEGWYGVELLGGQPMRWTRPRFGWRCPAKPIARFELSARLPPEANVSAVGGILEHEGDELARFTVGPGHKRVRLDLPKPVAGGDFVITLDGGWVPAQRGLGHDRRTLGMLVASLDSVPADGDLPEAVAQWEREPPAGRASEVDPEHSLDFEERFRGTRRVILERQRAYAPYFAERWNILDLGCGRGEFLELLRETGSDGWGVDANPRSVADCVARGLRAIEGDLIFCLDAVGDETLDGIFCAQVIEHLPRAALLRVLALARRKLRSDGRILLETVNPRCLTVFSDSFYVDPGHDRPVPVELLAFDLEKEGFQILETLFRSPVKEDSRLPPLPATGSAAVDAALEQWRSRLNGVLFSDRDYAVLARKPE